MAKNDIKTMKLYNYIDRIKSELAANGLEAGQISVEKLSEFDSLHYLGNEAITRGIEQTKLGENQTVLDIGSGLGGPARMLHHYTQCKVVALELQEDLHEMARNLTMRCNIVDIEHVNGNILEIDIIPEKFDCVMSWLVFLHIPNSQLLFTKIEQTLKKGGMLYVEDFYCKGAFTDTEVKSLKEDVYVDRLSTMDELQKNLNASGLELVQMQDMTEKWTDYVQTRCVAYKKNIERHVGVYGKDGAYGLLHFYESVNRYIPGVIKIDYVIL